jgi:hypothetical protein
MEEQGPKLRRPAPGRRAPEGRLNVARLAVWLVLALVLGAGGWALFGLKNRSATGRGAGDAPLSSETEAGLRRVVLFFADHNAESLVQERHEVPFGNTLEENVETVLRAWARGPQDPEALAVVPAQVRITQAFFDEEDATLYVDFNTALVTQLPGGSAAEFHLLGALVRTVGANFPEVTSVQILVDGQPVDSLAGHYDTSGPLRVAAWQ